MKSKNWSSHELLTITYLSAEKTTPESSSVFLFTLDSQVNTLLFKQQGNTRRRVSQAVSMTSTCSTRDYRRSLDYLRLIFAHATRRVADVLKEKEGHYARAYDELVLLDGHGTPGTRRLSVEQVPRIVPLPSSHLRRRLSTMQKEEDIGRIRRAEELVDSFNNMPSWAIDYWEKMWGGTYKGFREAQKEIGVLRDDITRGKYIRVTSRYPMGYLRKHLNIMLRSSVGEWYKKWGELDLHRLSTRDAIEVIEKFMKHPPWTEMRIVAGQRQHTGEDHSSEGILYDLIHCIFDSSGSEVTVEAYSQEQKDAILSIRNFVTDNQVEHCFYSNGAAVFLIRPPREWDAQGTKGRGMSRTRSGSSKAAGEKDATERKRRKGDSSLKLL